MIKVYQIRLTDAEVDAINRGEETEKSKAYFGRSFDRTFNAENFQHYDHVANVFTDNMEEAFTLMNLWNDCSKVTLVDGGCPSMSVGDILDVDGTLFRCASVGFDKI